jgi:hypothetical protein
MGKWRRGWEGGGSVQATCSCVGLLLPAETHTVPDKRTSNNTGPRARACARVRGCVGVGGERGFRDVGPDTSKQPLRTAPSGVAVISHHFSSSLLKLTASTLSSCKTPFAFCGAHTNNARKHKQVTKNPACPHRGRESWTLPPPPHAPSTATTTLTHQRLHDIERACALVGLTSLMYDSMERQ